MLVEMVIIWLFSSIVGGVGLWVGMKFLRMGTILSAFGVAGVSAIFDLIPKVGWLLSCVVMYILLCKYTEAEFWPDAFGLVLIARVFALLGIGLLVNLLLKASY